MNDFMKKWLPWLPTAIPGVLGLGFLLLTRLPFLAFMFLGIALVCLSFRFLVLFSKEFPSAAAIPQQLLTALITLGILTAAIPGCFVLSAAEGKETSGSPYVLVLGCQVRGNAPSPTLQSRLDAAFAYLQANPETICIVTGGKGTDETMSEAACMAQTLVSMGIDESRIWLEDKATSTKENLLLSMALIEEKTGVLPGAVTIISSETHLCRAEMMAKDLGLYVSTVPAVTNPWLLRVNNGLREIAAIWKYMLTGG